VDKRHELDRIAHMRSKLFLEAAEIYSIAEVAAMLRAQASHLDEFS
jgi:hypothetical protein